MRLRLALSCVATLVLLNAPSFAQAPPPNAAPGSEPPAGSVETPPVAAEAPAEAPAEGEDAGGAPPPATPEAPASAAPAPEAPPSPEMPASPGPPPAPIAPAPAFQPAFIPGQPLPVEIGATGSASEPPPETTLAIELDGGIGTRLGDSSDYGFDYGERAGLVFGPSVWLSPSRLWSVGVAYQRVALGTDVSEPDYGSMSVKRDLDVAWLAGRAYPWRTDDIGLFVGLQVGASWQHASADGTRETTSFVRPSEPFRCSEGAGPGFALGGALGIDVDIERDLAFLTQLDATGHRHTSDSIDGCAPGSGSVTAIAARIGFAYRFDLEPRRASSARTDHAHRL